MMFNQINSVLKITMVMMKLNFIERNLNPSFNLIPNSDQLKIHDDNDH